MTRGGDVATRAEAVAEANAELAERAAVPALSQV